MSGIVLVIFYGSIAFFFLATAYKLTGYATSPLHLRWELYRGSSIYEQSDWWIRKTPGLRHKSLQASKDVLSLRGYYRQNKIFWLFLYFFHGGLFILILWHIWLFAGAIFDSSISASGWELTWGHAATVFVLVGGSGVLTMRLLGKTLRIHYPRVHYLKWLFILVTLVGGFYAVYFHFADNISNVLAYVGDQLTFQLEYKLRPPLPTAFHVLLASLWLVYLPFSHMMRLFLRYYHELRWDHVPNLRGSRIEKRIDRLLDRRLTWSAPHVQPGRTWRETTQVVP